MPFQSNRYASLLFLIQHIDEIGISTKIIDDRSPSTTHLFSKLPAHTIRVNNTNNV